MMRSRTYSVNYFLINVFSHTLNLLANLQVKDSSNKEGFSFPFPSLWTTLSLYRDSGLGCIILYCSTGFLFQSDILTCAPNAEHVIFVLKATHDIVPARVSVKLFLALLL